MSYLLNTKTKLPPLQAIHISRERLLQGMVLNRGTRLILVSAPAGFGKSSYLIELAHIKRQSGAKVVWYSLDEQDNDPARFAAYMINAFRELAGNFESLPTASNRVTIHEAVHGILNQSAEHDSPVMLVLDDYHLITNPQIHDATNRICTYLPANMQIAIGTRADPPIQLARLRAQQTIAEIRMADLRFSRKELVQWLESAMGWLPSQHVIQQLETMTEGWAAALSLIKMAFHKQHAPVGEQGLSDQLARYSQTRRHIFDYFAQEILEQQTDEIRGFLLDTCVLNQLHPDVCGTLTNTPSAPLLLNQIAAENLFVISLSDTEPAYRYHHLFAQFLRQHLQMQDPARYLNQHQQAAQWYAKHENIIAAVYHTLEAELYDDAATLIEQTAWQALTSRGEITTLIDWLLRFPEDILQGHPRLCLYLSRALYLTGDIERSAFYVQIVSDKLGSENNTATQQQKILRAITANYQATLAAYHGDIVAGQRFNAQAMQLSDVVEGTDQVRIANTNAYLHYLAGHVPIARQAYEHALTLAQAIDHHYLTLDAHYYLAQLDWLAGDLQMARDRCQNLLAQYPTNLAPLSTIMLPLAWVYYEKNETIEAERLLNDAISLATQGHVSDILWAAHTYLAGIFSSRGAFTEALAHIQDAKRIIQDLNKLTMQHAIAATQARIYLKMGQLDKANDWATGYRQISNADYQRDYEDLTLARVLLRQNDYPNALTLLEAIIESAQAGGRNRSVIEAEVLRALVQEGLHDGTASLASIEHALTLASTRGFVRLFLDEGQSLINLLRRTVETGRDAQYAAHLLSIHKQQDTLLHPADALTNREIEILQHIAAGESNQTIAQALVISLGTVKSHVHHIMNKLDAENRTEAVSKARSLNILSD